MREVAFGEKTPPEKICRSKSTNQFGERNERLPDLRFSICRFSQVVFIPQTQPHAQSFLLFPIVFGINLIHFFDFFDDKEERCSRKFDRLLCCFDRLSITPFDSAKNANCFEKCNVFGNGKCELSAIQEGEKLRCKFFLARKSSLSLHALRRVERSTGSESERVDALGLRAVEVIICMITRDFSVISMTSQASLSLSTSHKSH